MAQPYIGEIRMFAGNFAPAGWALCNGQLLPISENDALFTLIGTTYGGDGQTTFALPDLRGRLPVHQGTGPGLGSYILGETGGAELVTLTVNQLPAHNHRAQGTSGEADRRNPKGALPARPREAAYADSGSPASLNASIVSPAGGSQPHSNMQPYLCVHFIISLFGIFPIPS
jgi:microcystin-dependent protein